MTLSSVAIYKMAVMNLNSDLRQLFLVVDKLNAERLMCSLKDIVNDVPFTEYVTTNLS